MPENGAAEGLKKEARVAGERVVAELGENVLYLQVWSKKWDRFVLLNHDRSLQ